jgi:hypothetical protein
MLHPRRGLDSLRPLQLPIKKLAVVVAALLVALVLAAVLFRLRRTIGIRLTLMRIVALLYGVFFLATIPQAISPWGTLSFGTGVRALPLHRWSSALAGGPDLGVAVVLFYIAWRPLRVPLALQMLALGTAVFLGANLPFVGPALGVIAIPAILVLVLYPKPRDLFNAPWSAGVSWPLLGLGILVSIFLLPDAVIAIAAQIRNSDVLAANYDWASNGEHLINVSLHAVLAGMSKAGAGVLRVVAGAVLVFLGAAAIAVPNDPGSWGTLGGWLAIAVGVAIAATSAYEWRRRGDAERFSLQPVSAHESRPDESLESDAQPS